MLRNHTSEQPCMYGGIKIEHDIETMNILMHVFHPSKLPKISSTINAATQLV